MRAVLRIAKVLAHVAGGYITIKRRFGTATLSERQAHVQQWAQRFCVLLGVSIQIEGQPLPTAVGSVGGAVAKAQSLGPGMLLVANHISWLDILVLLAVRPVRFVSKSEVKDWPVIGPMATGAGTLYIERAKKRDALRVMHVMADALKAGDCVGVFPEGTTGDGTKLLPFHANLLQAAISANAPALPVVMSFMEPGSPRLSQAASYLGDDTLVASLWRVLNGPGINVRLRFLPLQNANSPDRRAWADALHAQMAAAHAELLG